MKYIVRAASVLLVMLLVSCASTAIGQEEKEDVHSSATESEAEQRGTTEDKFLSDSEQTTQEEDPTPVPSERDDPQTDSAATEKDIESSTEEEEPGGFISIEEFEPQVEERFSKETDETQEDEVQDISEPIAEKTDDSEETEESETGAFITEEILKQDSQLAEEQKPSDSPLDEAPEEYQQPEPEELQAPSEPVDELPEEEDQPPEPEEPQTLIEAVEAGDKTAAEQFVLEDSSAVNRKNEQGQSPLHIAAALGNEGMVRLLLQYQADLRAADAEGNLPIHLAAEHSYSLAKTLAGNGSLVFEANNSGRSVLERAFETGPEALERLLGEQLVNVADNEGSTALHTAVRRGDLPAVEKLIELGADISVYNHSGELPIDIAFRRTESTPHVRIAKLLIEHYSLSPKDQQFYYAYRTLTNDDVNMRFEGGKTPVHYAAMYDHPALMELFISEGANLAARNERQNTPLHTAVLEQQLQLIQILVTSGANVNARGMKNNSPLHLAIGEETPIEIARYLLDHDADVNSGNSDGNTPLALAANKEVPVSFTELLLDHNADPNSKDRAGNTPLLIALTQENHEVCELLLASGADIYAQNHNSVTPLIRSLVKGEDVISWFYRSWMNTTTDTEGNTPLHKAVEVAAEPGAIQHIIDSGADLNAGNLREQTPLHLAVTNSYEEGAKLLVVSGADMFAYDNQGQSPLILAYEEGFEFTKQLLTKQEITASDPEGNTPLHFAAELNHSSIASFLIESGGQLHARNNQGEAPLHLAAKNNSIESIRVLFNHDADLDTRDNYGSTPLHASISRGKRKAAKYLLLLGSRVNLRNLSGNTPLHIAVLQRDMDAIKMLREYNASLETRDNTGMTALLLAARRNYLEVAKKLIEFGADYNTRDDRGNTPLHEAVRNRNRELCQLLTQHGASIYATNRYGDSPLLIALQSGKEVTNWFLTGSLLFSRDNHGNTPLHTAVSLHVGADIIELLIDKGAEINSRNNRIQTPLHIALESNSRSAAEALSSAGADLFVRNGEGQTALSLAFSRGEEALSWIVNEKNVNTSDELGNTVLHEAADYGSTEAVSYLLALGADIDEVNLAGETAMDVAASQNHSQVVSVLEQAAP